MKASVKRPALAHLVDRFLSEMRRYDGGRTLPLPHAAKLTTAQIAALEFVHASRTISAVADHVGLSRPATSQMVGKLVRRRLVRRSENAADRRERTAILSARGKALLEKIAAARAGRFEAALAVLPSPVAGRLKAALIEVVAALDKGNGRVEERRDP